MENILRKYIPETAVTMCCFLLKQHKIQVKIVNDRATKNGDYRRFLNGQHQVTINTGLNSYNFLMTLIHEIAHAVVAQKYGRSIKPHGWEWKSEFQRLMVPFLSPSVFPKNLLPLLARHFKNPKASSGVDVELSLALKQYDREISKSHYKSYVYQLSPQAVFKYQNGQRYRVIKKLTKRYECEEIDTGRIFRFSPQTEVEVLYQ